MREKMVNGGDDEEADEYADEVDGVDVSMWMLRLYLVRLQSPGS